MSAQDVNTDLLFPIRSAPVRNLYAGFLRDGRQVLISCTPSGDMLMIVFDSEGNFLQASHQTLPSPPQLLHQGFRRAVYEDDYEEYVDGALGLSPGVIRVKAFSVPHEMLAVYRMPKHYEEFLTNPNSPSFSDEDRKDYPELIEHWNESGCFVLELGNDYWVDGNGDIVAS